MPMLSAMARTTVGPPPRNRPSTPSSRTMRICCAGDRTGRVQRVQRQH
jgi:hypothetical protein